MLYRPGKMTRPTQGTVPAHEDQIISNAAALPFPLETKLDARP